MTHPLKLFLLTATAALTISACTGVKNETAAPTPDAPAASSETWAVSKEGTEKDKMAMADKKIEESMSASDRTKNEKGTDASMESKINTPYNAFLETYVMPKDGINLVAYEAVTDEDAASLQKYIETMADTDISTFSEEEKMAYWFNLYNATTLDLILDNYPVNSIKDIKDPWSQKLVNVRGATMSLNEIEHDTLRDNYDEPRIHFAVNCASIGCPNLKTTAWEAKTLDADLTQAAKDYVESSRGISVSGGGISASKIFDWYKEDFGSNEEEVLSYLSQFAKGDKKTAIQNANKIRDYDYDWSLNRTK